MGALLFHGVYSWVDSVKSPARSRALLLFCVGRLSVLPLVVGSEACGSDNGEEPDICERTRDRCNASCEEGVCEGNCGGCQGYCRDFDFGSESSFDEECWYYCEDRFDTCRSGPR